MLHCCYITCLSTKIITLLDSVLHRNFQRGVYLHSMVRKTSEGESSQMQALWGRSSQVRFYGGNIPIPNNEIVNRALRVMAHTFPRKDRIVWSILCTSQHATFRDSPSFDNSWYHWEVSLTQLFLQQFAFHFPQRFSISLFQLLLSGNCFNYLLLHKE